MFDKFLFMVMNAINVNKKTPRNASSIHIARSF